MASLLIIISRIVAGECLELAKFSILMLTLAKPKLGSVNIINMLPQVILILSIIIILIGKNKILLA